MPNMNYQMGYQSPQIQAGSMPSTGGISAMPTVGGPQSGMPFNLSSLMNLLQQHFGNPATAPGGAAAMLGGGGTPSIASLLQGGGISNQPLQVGGSGVGSGVTAPGAIGIPWQAGSQHGGNFVGNSMGGPTSVGPARLNQVPPNPLPGMLHPIGNPGIGQGTMPGGGNPMMAHLLPMLQRLMQR